jgi:hypothetical protein
MKIKVNFKLTAYSLTMRSQTIGDSILNSLQIKTINGLICSVLFSATNFKTNGAAKLQASHRTVFEEISSPILSKLLGLLITSFLAHNSLFEQQLSLFF